MFRPGRVFCIHSQYSSSCSYIYIYIYILLNSRHCHWLLQLVACGWSWGSYLWIWGSYGDHDGPAVRLASTRIHRGPPLQQREKNCHRTISFTSLIARMVGPPHQPIAQDQFFYIPDCQGGHLFYVPDPRTGTSFTSLIPGRALI